MRDAKCVKLNETNLKVCGLYVCVCERESYVHSSSYKTGDTLVGALVDGNHVFNSKTEWRRKKLAAVK